MSVLEDVRLVITSTDHDGVATAKEVKDFKLFEDREATYEFQVPQWLSCRVSLTLPAGFSRSSRRIDTWGSEPRP